MIDYFKKYKSIKIFKNHNYNFFKSNLTKKNIILVELNKWSYLHVIKSYISNCLSIKFNANILGFESYTLISEKLFRGLFKKIIRSILIKLSLGTYGIYKSFGVKEFVYPNIDKKLIHTKKKLINKIVDETNTKEKFLNLSVNKIYIGDLLYDTYLKKFETETVDIKSPKFTKFLKDALLLFYWWLNYIQANNKIIKAVVVVHSVYTFGLPSRIASKFNIDTYLISHKSIVKLNRNNQYITDDVSKNHKIFKKIKSKQKKKIYKFVKNEISKITKGISTTGKNFKKKIKHNLKIPLKKYKKKILICCHHFRDAPHVYGKFFATDFQEWYEILKKISKKTDYLWLIKPHPENYENDKKFFEIFFKNNKDFIIVKKKYSNQEILKSKIDLALTCFGTVSFEYPFLDTRVVNFTKNHPYRKYKFSLTPRNLKHYESIIKNYKKFDYTYNKEQILEFYFIKRIFLNVDFMYLNLDPKRDLNGYRLRQRFFETKFYDNWILNLSKKKHNLIIKNINNFLNSKDYFINNLHIEKSNLKNLNSKTFNSLFFGR